MISLVLLSLRIVPAGDAYLQYTETRVLWFDPALDTAFSYPPFRMGFGRGIFRAKALWGDFKAQAEIAHDFYYGNQQAFSLTRQSLEGGDVGYIDLEALSSSGRAIQRDYLRRGFVEYRGRFLRASGGRRVLNWSRTFFWTPLNPFTPQNNLSTVPEDIPFLDCATLSLVPVGFFSLEGMFSPAPKRAEPSDYRAGARALLYLPGWDVVLETAYDRGDTLVGAGFSTNLLDGALRAEAAFYPGAAPRYVMGYDRRFPGGIYILAEWYHNGWASGTRAISTNPYEFYKKDYLGAYVSRAYDVVWNFSFYGVLCASDMSFMLMGQAKRGFGRGFEIATGALFFWGQDPRVSWDAGVPVLEPGDYFGGLRPAGFLGLEYSF